MATTDSPSPAPTSTPETALPYVLRRLSNPSPQQIDAAVAAWKHYATHNAWECFAHCALTQAHVKSLLQRYPILFQTYPNPDTALVQWFLQTHPKHIGYLPVRFITPTNLQIAAQALTPTDQPLEIPPPYELLTNA